MTATSANFSQPSVRPSICHLRCMNEPFCILAMFFASGFSLGIPMKVNCWYLLHSPREEALMVPFRSRSALFNWAYANSIARIEYRWLSASCIHAS